MAGPKGLAAALLALAAVAITAAAGAPNLAARTSASSQAARPSGQISLPGAPPRADVQAPQPDARLPEPQANSQACLDCHGDPALAVTLPSGETLPLFISPEALAQSVHERLGIGCDSCHPDITGYPHPAVEFATRRELTRSLYLTCRTCHSANYERTLDSMHAQAAAAGQSQAPVCTDCHGAHDVRPPDEPRSLISETCGQCHTAIFAQYRNSVHGEALIRGGNPEVPVCTDCHGVHNIPDPRTAQFRIQSPELCAGCHADPALMGKYGLSAEVYQLYTVSWHGVDVVVYKSHWPGIWHESAVCTDCHGVHDIRAAQDPASRVNPDNLLGTCRQCHPIAGPNWTGAWIGHDPVSRERTPFVFYTQAFYRSFTPAVLIPAAVYLTLQVIRALVARIRRSLP
jgi:predicted CXXCH cytochrome family protein